MLSSGSVNTESAKWLVTLSTISSRLLLSSAIIIAPSVSPKQFDSDSSHGRQILFFIQAVCQLNVVLLQSVDYSLQNLTGVGVAPEQRKHTLFLGFFDQTPICRHTTGRRAVDGGMFLALRVVNCELRH